MNQQEQQRQAEILKNENQQLKSLLFLIAKSFYRYDEILGKFTGRALNSKNEMEVLNKLNFYKSLFF